MKLTGSASANGMEIGMTQTIVNDKGMRMDMTIMGTTGYTIITPDAGWSYMPIQPGAKVTPLPPDMIKMYKGKLKIKSNLLVDKSTIAKAEYMGKDTVNTISCYKVKVTDKDGNVQMAFFDAATYYMVHSELKVKVQDEEQEMAMNYSNFQKQPKVFIIL